MEYFSGFPKITARNGTTIKDLTIRLDFIQKIKDNISIFQLVQINGGQRPEDVAYAYYGDPTLYWVILFLNNIVDPYYDWHLTDSQLLSLVKAKYTDINAIHHYVSTANNYLGAGVIVDVYASDKTSVTNMEFEQAQNESKRRIKILKPEYLAQVLSEYQAELRSTT